jgi:hypothetical protein
MPANANPVEHNPTLPHFGEVWQWDEKCIIYA